MNHPLIAFDATQCHELPQMAEWSATYYGYINGSLGYIVLFAVLAAVMVGVAKKKGLTGLPTTLATVVLAALAIGAMPQLLDSFGIGVGCGGGNTPAPTQPAPENTPSPAENASIDLGDDQ